MIKELDVVAKDRVGLIADMSYILAKNKINIESIDTGGLGETVIVKVGVLSAKYDRAKEALKENGFEVLPPKALIIRTKDEPGTLAEVTRKLADKKVDILEIHLLGKKDEYHYFSVIVDKQKEAMKVLGDHLVNEF